ncbi:MAG: hypothetical protein M1840_002315 [Geoglossum simile]|nr:MAG: hypothetical protein M1840_002315 [Geoglossum simile]
MAKRSEKMVKGLGLFVEGKSTLREWWLEAGTKNPRRDQEASSRKKAKTPLGVDSMPSSQHISAIRSVGDDPHPAGSRQSLRTSAADLHGDVLSENLKHMFSRASNIIRECIKVDGALFLDASISTFGGYTGHKFYIRPGQSEPTGRSQESLASSSESSKDSPAETPSQVSSRTEMNALLQMLPDARSVVLFPLWDSHRERWFAGSFAWTTRSTRVLTHAEDLSYLAAFGNSIMADVARLDAMAADRAKSDFISSISHELRSPLHGILASVEFLQDTKIDLFQNSMIDTIERCGRSLLDTIQHVLDFAKINNFAKPKRNEGKDQGPPEEGSRWRAMGLTADIDLSLITEDVVDAVYAGHEFQGKSSLGVYDEASSFPSEGLRGSVSVSSGATPDQRPDLLAKKERLDIIMDIGWRSNWDFDTQSGALMNLFGNALNYTDAGWVYISLQSKDIEPTLSQSPQSAITIIVSDSGRGMSQEFLRGHLFTTFSQENSLNPGTGLGLSIVLQIVHSLGGTLNVQSKQGVGTKVKVSLTLSQVPLPPRFPTLDAKYENSLMGVGKRTSRLNLCLLGFDVYLGISGTRLGLGQVDHRLHYPSKRHSNAWPPNSLA